jgi:SAM-dependent MidA family methyltransferase
LVARSAPLRDLQRRAVAASGHDGAWHEEVQEVPTGAAIIVANEFLDALPIRQLVLDDGRWRERVIEAPPEGGLRFAAGAAIPFAARPGAPDGAIVELRPGQDALLAVLAARRDPLAALLVDYGPAEHAYGDTLQAVRRHGYADPLACPGRADLTAHVQFGPLAASARALGLAVDGPITQAEFLGRLGLAERAAALMSANPQRAGEIETAAQRLISPPGMGSLFKAMAVRSPALPRLAPFG